MTLGTQKGMGRANQGWLGQDGPTLVYGIAHFGKSLFWYTSELLFAFYLSEVCGLGPKTMGWVLAAGLMLGAGADLGFAWRLSRHLTSPAAAARLQWMGAALSAICLAATFLIPEIPPAFRIVYAFATGLAFRFAYVLYDVPQNALVSLGTTDDDSRSRVSALRIIFSGLASLGVSLSAILLFTPGLAWPKAERFFAMGLAWSLAAIATSTALARLDWQTPPAEAAGRAPTRRAPAVPMSMALLLALAFIASATTSIFAKTEPYYMSYVLKDTNWGGAILIAISAGTAAGPPVWNRLSLHHSRRIMFGLTAIALIASALAFWAVGRQPAAALVAAFLFGVANGGLSVVLWAAFADAVKVNPRIGAGLAFGLFTAVMKAALAVGVLGLGMALAAADYRSGVNAWLLAPMCGIPAAGGGLVLLAMVFKGKRSARPGR